MHVKSRTLGAPLAAVIGLTDAEDRTVAAMADDAIEFINVLGLEEVDLLGFSLGSFVAQEIALHRPDLVNRIVLASSAPQGATGIHGWRPDVIDYHRSQRTTSSNGRRFGRAIGASGRSAG